MQELISSVESRAKVVGKDLEEINGWFDRHRGEINRLKIREKDGKEEVKKLKGFIVGAGHEVQVFKNRLDRMEENVCRCGRTPLEVGEELVSSEDEGRTELSYASAAGAEYIAPPVENSIPLPIPALGSCCLGPTTTLPPMEEITKEPTFICEDLDGLLREADEGRARDLQEGSSQSVVRSPPRLGSERWRRLNGIHCMRPGPGRREQRATCSRPYIRRDSSRHSGELQSPGESGEPAGSLPRSRARAIDKALLRGDVSRIQLLTSKISHICQEIRDIKSRRRPQTNIAIQNYTNTGLVEGQTNPNCTQVPDSNNFAKEGSNDEDGLGETYSSHSKQCHRAPNSPDIPSHHAPSLPSPNPLPSESILEPPGDLSPSPTSRIATLSPSLLL